MFENYPHILGAFYNEPWLISAGRFDEIELALRTRLMNGPSIAAEFEAARPSKREIRSVSGDVGVIRVHGTLTARPSIMSSGGTSCREISEALTEMVADPDVSAIVMDFNTPGGQVVGVEELGAQIAEAKKTTQILASVNHLCASAGYWLAAQTSSISVSPNSSVGSIGVIYRSISTAKADEMAGIATTIVTAGRRKGSGDPSMPLDEETRKNYQDRADFLYKKFVAAVATGRGVSREKVMSAEWGEGDILLAEAALECGMVDRICTLAEVVAQLRGKSNDSRKRSMKMSVAKADAKILGE